MRETPDKEVVDAASVPRGSAARQSARAGGTAGILRGWPGWLTLANLVLTIGGVAFLWPVLRQLGTVAAVAVALLLLTYALVPFLLLRSISRRKSQGN